MATRHWLWILLLACLSTGALTHGGVRAQEDWENTAPVSWGWTVRDVPDLRFFNHTERWGRSSRRLVSLERTRSGRYAAVWVDNVGAFARDTRLVFGLDTAAMQAELQSFGGRLLDIESEEVSAGVVRHTGVMVRNLGHEAKTWWWEEAGSVQSLTQLLNQRNARLVALSRYRAASGDRWSAIMLRNTGVDFRNWGWLAGASLAQIDSYAQANGMRIIDLQEFAGNFNAVLVQDPVPVRSDRVMGVRQEDLRDIAEDRVMRVQHLAPAASGQSGEFDALLVEVGNDAERRVRGLLDQTDGRRGALFQSLSGDPEEAPQLPVAINVFEVFEPASLMHMAVMLQALHAIDAGSARWNSLISVALGSNGACPTGSGGTSVEGLRSVVSTMMQQSDNRRARALVPDRWSAQELDMTLVAQVVWGADYNHVTGCGGPVPNEMTLDALGRIFQSARGLTQRPLGAGLREEVYGLMRNRLTIPAWASGGDTLESRLQARAGQLGWSTRTYQDFTSRIDVAWMPGRYSLAGLHYLAECGLIRLPERSVVDGSVRDVEFVFAAFNHGASSRSTAEQTVSDACLAALWPEVQRLMDDWTFGAGEQRAFGEPCWQQGLAGEHVTTRSAPRVGQSANFELRGASLQAPATLVLGLSGSAFGGLPLPAIIPLTDCQLRVAADVTLPALIDLNGAATVSLPVPNDAGLVGQRLFTQFLIIDPGANQLGALSSNAVVSSVGAARR